RATFLMSFAQASSYLRSAGSHLSATERSEIQGYLDSAIALFQEGTASSLARASFILGQTTSLTTYSLERSGIQATYDGTRGVTIMVDVENMPLFQTDGSFDTEKFRRLTGVSYDDYRNGTTEVRRGLATLLCSRYSSAIGHYTRAADGIRGLIRHA